MDDNTNNGEAATWEVVSVTDSMHAAVPGPHGPDSPTSEPGPHETAPLDEAKEKEAQPSDALFMSGHFSLSKKDELETLLLDNEIKSSIQNNSFEPDPDQIYEEKSTKDELELSGTSWIEPKLYSPSEFVASRDIGDNSGCSEEKGSEEEVKGEWWKKVGLFYQKARGEKMFVVFVAATALVGVAILSRKLQRDRLQLQKFKLQFNLSNERMSSMVVGPLNRIKGVFLANNQHRPLIHSESTFSH